MRRSSVRSTGHHSLHLPVSARLAMAVGVILLVCPMLPARDWTGFRGPGGAATSAEQDLPVRWSADENIVWRTELPGPGTSSPTVVGNRVYLTCYTGYGEDEAHVGDQEDLMRHVVSVDRDTGRIVVTDSHVLWRTNKGSNVSSPVYHDGHLYWVHDGRGVAYCLDASTGDVVYEQRLAPRPGRVYSSVMLADGKLYAASQHDGTYVISAKPEFELLAHNTFEGDEARANAMPVPSRGQLLLRNDAYLYCIGEK